MHHSTILPMLNAVAALSWLVGTLLCFTLVIQPHPNIKPVSTRLRATLCAVLWCWLMVSIFTEANGLGAFPGHGLMFGAVFALVWAVPCFAFLAVVTAVSKWVER
jgi:hypothetical protein